MYSRNQQTQSDENPPPFVHDLPWVERLAVASLIRQPEKEGSGIARCATCKGEHLHLVASGVHQDRELHLVMHDGLHLIRGLPQIGRGSAVVTLLQGECGHDFARVERFHKGSIYCGLMQLPPRNPEDITDWLPCLWRS